MEYDSLCETRLTEPQKARMFGTRLGGLAAAWYTELELGTKTLTLEHVCELFMNRYCPLEEGVHEQAWEELRSGKFKLGQPKRLTLISYMASFKDQVMKASHKAGPPEELLRLFVDGIKDHSPTTAKEIHYDGIRRVKTLEEVYTGTLAIYSKEHNTGTHPPEGANNGLATVGKYPLLPGIPVRALEVEEEEETNASVAYKPNKMENSGGELVDMMKTLNQSISFIVANQANPGVNPHFPTVNAQVFERLEAERAALHA